MHPTGTLQLADWLVQQRLINRSQRDELLQQLAATPQRVEEAVLQAGLVSEGDLLRTLAGAYETRFVSTPKLARAPVNEGALRRVPRSVAEHWGIFPVSFDAEGSVLRVVTADPGDRAALEQLASRAQVTRVEAVVARPRAIRAAIARHYGGDIHAFARLADGPDSGAQMSAFNRDLLSKDHLARAAQRAPLSAREPGETASPPDPQTALAGVLVNLLEGDRGELRGHAAHVGQLMAKMAQRVGLSSEQLAAYRLAGLLHDLGRMDGGHLTALAAGTSRAERQRASALSSAAQLLEATPLPTDTRGALETFLERFDGQGLPRGLAGQDIPLGGRLLAIVDSYADLTRNSQNPLRRRLEATEACEVLERYVPSLFDPNLVELFRLTVTGDDLRSRLLADRPLALLVDPDPEQTTVLELRLVEHGFEVRIARTAEQALVELRGGEVQAVVSELRLGQEDGLALLERARQDWPNIPWVIVSDGSERQQAARAFELGAADYLTKPIASDLLVAKLRKILESGPSSSAQGRARGVSGSLEEMGLPEIVQVLWHGRKTGALRLSGSAGRGEIHFMEGQIVHAQLGALRGAEAFYALAAMLEGRFELDPGAATEERTIDGSPEGLLLEAMRRMDESAA